MPVKGWYTGGSKPRNSVQNVHGFQQALQGTGETGRDHGPSAAGPATPGNLKLRDGSMIYLFDQIFTMGNCLPAQSTSFFKIMSSTASAAHSFGDDGGVAQLMIPAVRASPQNTDILQAASWPSSRQAAPGSLPGSSCGARRMTLSKSASTTAAGGSDV
jgi:hypothetical protein